MCCSQILQHPLRISQDCTSFNASALYILWEIESNILQSAARVNFCSATYIDETNKYSDTSAQINKYFALTSNSM